jgi:hypothetical protein
VASFGLQLLTLGLFVANSTTIPGNVGIILLILSEIGTYLIIFMTYFKSKYKNKVIDLIYLAISLFVNIPITTFIFLLTGII